MTAAAAQLPGRPDFLASNSSKPALAGQRAEDIGGRVVLLRESSPAHEARIVAEAMRRGAERMRDEIAAMTVDVDDIRQLGPIIRATPLPDFGSIPPTTPAEDAPREDRA